MSNQPVVESLKKVLAETYALYLKTQNFHWNVSGPNFGALHAMFQTQYEEMALAIDELAERIRILGVKAPGGFSAFQSLSGVTDALGDEDAPAMVQSLHTDHQLLLHSLKETLGFAQDAGDEGTIALLSERIPAHEKTVWMLGASL